MLGNAFAQTERLTLKRENASMLDIIFAVEKQSKMTFVYSMDAVNKIGKITIDVKDVLIDSVMNVCLRRTDQEKGGSREESCLEREEKSDYRSRERQEE